MMKMNIVHLLCDRKPICGVELTNVIFSLVGKISFRQDCQDETVKTDILKNTFKTGK